MVAIACLVWAVVLSGIFGFSGIAGDTAYIPQIAFIVSLVALLLILCFGRDEVTKDE